MAATAPAPAALDSSFFRVRLDRAHEQLRHASPGEGASVTQIAAHWGFADSSRFAALYRATYGQLPSQTLRN